jgi:hypothetical protein
MKKEASKSGQVVLITLLVLVIATTVGLSLISRTTTDIRITSQVEQSSRAFSAAEAGVEEALNGLDTHGVLQSIVGVAGVKYSVIVSNIGGGSATGIYQFPKKTQEGATETFWLVNHDDATGLLEETPVYPAASTIDVCWSDEATVPAMVITLLYKVGTDYRVAKEAIDPNGSRMPPNQFSLPNMSGGCGGSTGTTHKERIDFSAMGVGSSDTVIALRIRPVYSDAKIVINADLIPKQGKSIESTGTTDSGTNRKILVYQQYRSPATVFDAAIYSQSNLVQ